MTKRTIKNVSTFCLEQTSGSSKKQKSFMSNRAMSDLSIISVDDEDDNEPIPNVDVTKRFNVLNNEKLVDTVLNNLSDNSMRKKSKIPPVIIKNQTYQVIRNRLSQLNIVNYSIKINRNGIRLQLNNVDDHKNVTSNFKQTAINFFSYELAEEKLIKIILTGLPNIDNNELMNELKNKNIQPVHITSLKLKKPKFDEQKIFLLYYKNGEHNLNELKGHKYIYNVAVNWSYYRKPNNITQCHRCQYYGHGSKQCNLPPHCAICGEEHLTVACTHYVCGNCSQSGHATSACTVPAKCKICKSTHSTKSCPQRVDPNVIGTLYAHTKCSNCGGSHMANYIKCPKREDYIAYRQTLRNPAKPKVRSNHFILNQQHFPGIKPPPTIIPPLSNKTSVRDHTNRPLYSTVTASNLYSDSSDLFNTSEFMNIIKEVFVKLKNCRSKFDQVGIIFEIVGKYLYPNIP